MIKFRDVQKSIITLLRAFNIHVSLRIEQRISDLNERKRERERKNNVSGERKWDGKEWEPRPARKREQHRTPRGSMSSSLTVVILPLLVVLVHPRSRPRPRSSAPPRFTILILVRRTIVDAEKRPMNENITSLIFGHEISPIPLTYSDIFLSLFSPHFSILVPPRLESKANLGEKKRNKKELTWKDELDDDGHGLIRNRDKKRWHVPIDRDVTFTLRCLPRSIGCNNGGVSPFRAVKKEESMRLIFFFFRWATTTNNG